MKGNNKMNIKVLSKPACSQCIATERALKSKGIEYTKEDVTQNADALNTAKGLGYASAPVVLVINKVGEIIDHWSGYRAEKINQYAS